MCGICGILDLTGQPIDQKILRQMADTLAHRGPDAEGFYCNPAAEGSPAVGLAHRRLSIIDIATGQQPLANEAGTVWIVFNGEIYNYLDVREELLHKGHVFKTRSDTETIVHAYEEWGESCVDRLRGMFAFAIWDENRQRLFVARDRLGIKPLYYYWDGKTLIFGSEIKAIVANPRVARKLNLEALCDYFTLLYIPAPKSIFQNIHKLEAGHVLTLTAGTVKIHQYWDLHFHPDLEVEENEWQERILTKLEEAVRIRLMSEVPLGAFLSGGVDSSAVVALMAGLMHESVKTASIGFQEQAFNELPYARQIAGQFTTDHHEQMVSPDSVAILDQLAWYFDEPFADSSAVPTYYVSQVAKQKVTVCLSGDGGDENFAGYRRYYFDRLENAIRSCIPTLIRQQCIKPLAGLYPKMDWAPQMFRAKTLLTNLAMDQVEGFFNSMSWFQGSRESLFTDDVTQQLAGYSPIDTFRRHYANAPQDPLSAVQYIDIKTYLVDDILTKVDRASMAHALEVRVPLLDHEFMELVANIPSKLKLKGREGKYILKKSLEQKLRHDTLHRPKKGFSVPLGQWLKNDLKPLFEQSVLNQTANTTQLLNKRTVETIWREHQSGQRERSAELWPILFFQKWREKWL